MCRQWRFQHSGSTRAFDYALYCRTRACMLVLPPTSLIKVVNSGSFHWALSVFIYFRFMLAFRVKFAGDVNQKISFATTALSNTFARSLLGLIHWSPSCPLHTRPIHICPSYRHYIVRLKLFLYGNCPYIGIQIHCSMQFHCFKKTLNVVSILF